MTSRNTKKKLSKCPTKRRKTIRTKPKKIRKSMMNKGRNHSLRNQPGPRTTVRQGKECATEERNMWRRTKQRQNFILMAIAISLHTYSGILFDSPGMVSA
eukprot:scaffold49509_cov45-Attheya_sp.AAC.1